MVDDVRLTDLQVIQQFSLAVRAATATREEIVAALRSDLAWLTGSAAVDEEPPVARRPTQVQAAPARRRAAVSAPAAAPRRTRREA